MIRRSDLARHLRELGL